MPMSELYYNNIWGDPTVQSMELDKLADYISTGKTAETMHPDVNHFQLFLGNKDKSLRILDFGCGIGRNSFELSINNPNWEIVGYDNENMIERSNEYKLLKYSNMPFLNLSFETNWDMLKLQHFDCIFANLVFQHIDEVVLRKYLVDIKSMSNKLLVHGRLRNDDNSKSTWEILEKEGYFPATTFSINGTGGIEYINYYNKADNDEVHCANLYIW